MATLGSECLIHSECSGLAEETGEGSQLALYAVLLPVDLDQKVSLSRWNDCLFSCVGSGRLKSETVGDLRRRWKISLGKNRLNRRRRFGHAGKTGRENRPGRGQRKKTQGRLSDHPEHAFGAAEEAAKIKPCLVLVGTTTQPGHRPIRENNLKSEDVAAGHPVFEAARAACIHRDISADTTVL